MHGQTCAVVYVDWHLREAPYGVRYEVPFVVGKVAEAQLLAIDPRLYGKEALHKLLTAHFKGEYTHTLTLQRRIVGDAEGQRGLSDTRAGGHDEEVASL